MCRECGAELELKVKESSVPNLAPDEIDEDRNCPMCGQPAYKRDRECRSCGERLPPSPLDTVLRDVPANPDAVTPTLVRRFRKECTALGVAWMVVGFLHFGFAVLMFRSMNPEQWWWLWIAGVVVVNGIGLVVVGLATTQRSMSAVVVGRVLNILAMLGCLAGFRVCFPVVGSLLLISPLLQANRLLGWGKRIEAAGYPLSINPMDVIETTV